MKNETDEKYYCGIDVVLECISTSNITYNIEDVKKFVVEKNIVE